MYRVFFWNLKFASERIRNIGSAGKRRAVRSVLPEKAPWMAPTANGGAAEGVHRMWTTVAANPLRRIKKKFMRNPVMKKLQDFLILEKDYRIIIFRGNPEKL